MSLFRLKDRTYTNQKFNGSALLLVVLVLACSAISPMAQAIVPPPDGGYPGGNTAEGQAALLSLTTGEFSTAIGWVSLHSNTTASFNTGVGAGTLFRNIAEENTAIGAGAMLILLASGIRRLARSRSLVTQPVSPTRSTVFRRSTATQWAAITRPTRFSPSYGGGLTEKHKRRGRESNPRIAVLQTATLPLGYPADLRERTISL